jgi:CheY-like chemotaxis protein
MSAASACPAIPITVLLIDDEPDICTVWTMVLEMHGMTAIAARNGTEGLEKARTHVPDVVLCDFMMPGMNGLDVCRAIRSDERLSATPLILWSAARGIETDGLVDLLVAKPVEIETLLDLIQRVLTQRKARGTH